MKAKVTMSLDEYEELIRRMERAESQLTTFCDMLLERAMALKGDDSLFYDDDFISQMLETYGYDVKGRVEELRAEYDKGLAPITIPEGVDDDLPFV